MRTERICKICGNKFLAIKTTQFFCSRKCFKKDYYVRMKIKELEKDQNPKYPSKQCGLCGKVSQLDFDPIKNPQKFNAWGCPHCGATNALVWEYQDNPNSHQLINNIIISVQAQVILDTTPQYQIYHLPVNRIEQGNQEIIVMTCEELNILDVQKRDRKKLSFS